MRMTFLFMVLSLASTAYAQNGRGRGVVSRPPTTNPGRPPVTNPGRSPYGSLPMPTAAMSTAAVLAAIFVGKKLKK